MTEPVDHPCPVCHSNDWGVDYVRTADGEMPVPDCNVCHWPGPGPRTVAEARAQWLRELAERD